MNHPVIEDGHQEEEESGKAGQGLPNYHLTITSGISTLSPDKAKILQKSPTLHSSTF